MIKNLIFDFGDIFINLDKKATYIELEKLGITEISGEMMAVANEYEKGLISTDKFIAFFTAELKIAKKDLVHAWNAVLLDFPLTRLAFIKALSKHKKYRLFLLSNTNELHISWIQENWGIKLFTEFKKCFEQFYLSHEIHFRKPAVEIYEFVLNENNLIAEETLFIDDVKENTISANALGIHTWNLIPGQEDVTQLFSKKELLF
ncbi:HAD family phosphatase [Polaribacter sp.]|nr:HAD family phosphatase [Polaribacter sp.]